MAELASAAPTSGGVSYSSFPAMIYVLTYMRDVRYDVFSSTFGPTRSPHLDGETCLLGSSAVSSRLCLFVSRYSVPSVTLLLPPRLPVTQKRLVECVYLHEQRG